MLEKPNLREEQIVACLHQNYGIPVARIEFLPIGYDSNAWVYRVDCSDGPTYFLKVRRGALYKPGILIPRFLKDHGIPQAVAPLPTTNGEYWTAAEGFYLILYPFIEGEIGLPSDTQWTAFGAFLSGLHSILLPPDLSDQIPRETFVSTWLPKLRALQNEVLVREYTHPIQSELAAFWKQKSDEITAVCDRVEEFERVLQNEKREFVLCHADIHTGNVLLDRQGNLHIVDWDQPLQAPKERDLMFIGAGVAEIATPAQVEAFYRGYGDRIVNPVAFAYYRYEWAVQDMGDFGSRVFLWDDMGEETKRDALSCFRSLFEPGRIIETAYRADSQGW